MYHVGRRQIHGQTAFALDKHMWGGWSMCIFALTLLVDSIEIQRTNHLLRLHQLMRKKMVPGNIKNPTWGMFYFYFYLVNNGINPLERCFNTTTCTKAEGHQRSEWKGDAVGCHAVCRWRFVGVTGSCPGWLVGWWMQTFSILRMDSIPWSDESCWSF